MDSANGVGRDELSKYILPKTWISLLKILLVEEKKYGNAPISYFNIIIK